MFGNLVRKLKGAVLHQSPSYNRKSPLSLQGLLAGSIAVYADNANSNELLWLEVIKVSLTGQSYNVLMMKRCKYFKHFFKKCKSFYDTWFNKISVFVFFRFWRILLVFHWSVSDSRVRRWETVECYSTIYLMTDDIAVRVQKWGCSDIFGNTFVPPLKTVLNGSTRFVNEQVEFATIQYLPVAYTFSDVVEMRVWRGSGQTSCFNGKKVLVYPHCVHK